MDTTSVAPPRPRTAARGGVPQPRGAGGRVAGGGGSNQRAPGDGRRSAARGPRPDPAAVTGGPARARSGGARSTGARTTGARSTGARSTGATGSRPAASDTGISDAGAGTRSAARIRSAPRTRSAAPTRSAVRVHPAAGVQLPAIPFVLLVLGLLGGGLVCLLVVNTTLGATSFRISQLQSANAKLSLREQTLLGQVADEESPSRIARRAYQLGMRPQTDGHILNLPARKFEQVPSHPGAQGLDSAVGLAPSASVSPAPSPAVTKSGATKTGAAKKSGTGRPAHRKRAARKHHRSTTSTGAGSGR